MAALASTAVLVLDSYYAGGQSNKRTLYRKLLLTLTGQGSDTNTIDAATLGFSKMEGCTNGCNGTVVIPAAVAYLGTKLYLADLTNATDANRANVADITALVVYVEVWGAEA